jgi:hypothetical protein
MSTPISRRLFCAGTLLPVAALLPGCGGGGSDAGPQAQALGIGAGRHLDTAAPARWAGIAIRAAALGPPPGLPPYIKTRAYAMAFLAAHDALNAIEPVYATYLNPGSAPGANPDAAVAAAVHDVLVHELPLATTLLDSEYAAALAAIVGGGAAAKGIAAGQASAAAMLAARANDGLADIEGPFTEGSAPGEYRFTPPFDFAAAVHLADRMTPFSIPSSSAYRVEAPYDVTSAAYAADFDEVKTLGAAVGSTRTADQSELAIFWLEGTFDSWMQIAVQLAAKRQMDGWALARTLALLQVGQADCYTAGFESKYHWRFWRPISAIRLGGVGGPNDADGNPATVGDAGWVSYDPVCPPVPDHPSTHSTSAGAGAAVLQECFGGDDATFTHQSVTLPGPTRSFTSFSQCAAEIAESRVCVGYHFRHAVNTGLVQGRQVGEQVMASRLKPRA